ncbi:hypothetical protein ACFUCQ_29275 [Streptomyces sp. NPDC057197]
MVTITVIVAARAVLSPERVAVGAALLGGIGAQRAADERGRGSGRR